MLDPDDPMTIGAMVGPEAFTEVRYLAHAKQIRRSTSSRGRGRFDERFGRASGGLLDGYRSEDAETIVLALGSVNGTLEEVVDELREQGARSVRSR